MRDSAPQARNALGRLSIAGGFIATLLLAILLPFPAPASASSEAQQAKAGGLYVALGDSVAWGYGASSRDKSYVGLLFSHYQSTLGVTQLSNRAQLGATSGSILTSGGQLDQALSDINGASDTRAVTIDIGGNDRYTCADSWDTCPVRVNFATALRKLKSALAADAGPEAFIAMAYYNPASGLGGTIEPYYDRQLLGSDLKVDCAITTGPKVGGDDVIFQEAAGHGAGVADPYAAFKSGGQALMYDSIHPNDAGYAAIADAFRNPSSRCARAPETTITKAPGARTTDRTPTFRFKSNPTGASFKCSVDGSRFKACTSPYTLKRLAFGRHVFKVKALLNGVADPTPAKYAFKVIRK